MRKILFFICVLSFLYCKPTKTVYVNNIDGVNTESFEAYNKGVHYEYGNSFVVYSDFIIHEGKKYNQLKSSDEYLLASSVDDLPHQIYLTINNIQGETIYTDEDLQRVLKILPFGYKVSFKSKVKNKGGVYFVEYADSSFGYMSSHNLKAQEEKEYFKVATTLGLVLREKPDQKSKQLALLPLNHIGEVKAKDNTVLTIAGRKGNWILTDYNRKEGWVFSGFVYLSKYKEQLAVDYTIEERFYSLFEKVDELKSFPITKKQIEKDFKEEEHPLSEDYSLRSIYRIGNDECQWVTYDSILNRSKGLEYEQNVTSGGYSYHVDFLGKKLYIKKYQTCTCCCVFFETRFHFLLKNKVLTYTFNDSSYNFDWLVDEKCNLKFEKTKYSEKDSTLYLYSLFPDCSIEPHPYEAYDSVVKFKDYTKELFIAVKIFEDDIQIKRFFDKSIPKEYLKSYEEAELLKF